MHYGNSTSLPPATKLGQGYVFKRVCDSVHRGWVSASVHAGIHPPDQTPFPPGAHTPSPREQCMLGDTDQQAGGTHPTGMHTCFKGITFH